jgi:hypothetical protein
MCVIENTPDGVQSTFASGFQTYGLAFQVVPEPSAWAMLALAGLVLRLPAASPKDCSESEAG